jgi:hypothetical protein
MAKAMGHDETGLPATRPNFKREGMLARGPRDFLADLKLNSLATLNAYSFDKQSDITI